MSSFFATFRKISYICSTNQKRIDNGNSSSKYNHTAKGVHIGCPVGFLSIST